MLRRKTNVIRVQKPSLHLHTQAQVEGKEGTRLSFHTSTLAPKPPPPLSTSRTTWGRRLVGVWGTTFVTASNQLDLTKMLEDKTF